MQGFYIHLAVYLAVNALLMFINFTGNSERLWFFYPLIGWGIGLAAHAAAVFGKTGAISPTRRHPSP